MERVQGENKYNKSDLQASCFNVFVYFTLCQQTGIQMQETKMTEMLSLQDFRSALQCTVMALCSKVNQSRSLFERAFFLDLSCQWR